MVPCEGHAWLVQLPGSAFLHCTLQPSSMCTILMSVCRALKEKKTGSHGYTAAGSTEGQQNANANGAVPAL